MRSISARCLVVVAGLLGLPATTTPHPRDLPKSYEDDPRLAKLNRLFERYDAPVTEDAEEFLVAADHHGLDWRLLPSIALIESGGGRFCAGNNLFGWDSGEQTFGSAREAIHVVADRLANSPLYRGKKIDAILTTYNPYAEYPARIKRVMRRLGTDRSVRN